MVDRHSVRGHLSGHRAVGADGLSTSGRNLWALVAIGRPIQRGVGAMRPRRGDEGRWAVGGADKRLALVLSCRCNAVTASTSRPGGARRPSPPPAHRPQPT